MTIFQHHWTTQKNRISRSKILFPFCPLIWRVRISLPWRATPNVMNTIYYSIKRQLDAAATNAGHIASEYAGSDERHVTSGVREIATSCLILSDTCCGAKKLQRCFALAVRVLAYCALRQRHGINAPTGDVQDPSSSYPNGRKVQYLVL